MNPNESHEYTYPALAVVRKSGTEPFREGGDVCPFNLLDFWRWMGSDLVNNAMRGVLAEFIVAKALGGAEGARVEWDAHDLIAPDGSAVEVKSAAYCQTWGQRALSDITFDIAPKLPDNIPGNDTRVAPRRPADVYVFCVLKHQDKPTIDPLNLDQWDFYVLPTRVLNEKVPTQKKIALSSLMKLGPLQTGFSSLRHAVEVAARIEREENCTDCSAVVQQERIRHDVVSSIAQLDAGEGIPLKTAIREIRAEYE
jgi:hypothetical protein